MSRTASKTYAGRVGNPHYSFGEDEGVGRAGVGSVKWRSGLRRAPGGDMVGAGLGFRGGDGIAWVFRRILAGCCLRSHSAV